MGKNIIIYTKESDQQTIDDAKTIALAEKTSFSALIMCALADYVKKFKRYSK